MIQWATTLSILSLILFASIKMLCLNERIIPYWAIANVIKINMYKAIVSKEKKIEVSEEGI